jgi:hypothetical protein
MTSLRRVTISSRGWKIALATCIIGLLSCGASSGWADNTTSAVPGDFGQYLVDHQDDLAPFFSKNSGEFVAAGVPMVLAWFGRIMFVTLIFGWILDVGLGRGFAALFAPSKTTLIRSLIYATGRLALGVVLAILLGLAVIPLTGSSNLTGVLALLVGIFILATVGVQIGWIFYLYRTDIFISMLFYLTLVVVHGFVALAISAPMIGAHASDSATTFVDQTITPKLQAEVRSTRQEVARLVAARDQTIAEVSQAQDQLDQAKAEQGQVQKEIEDQKHSSVFLFSQIVKAHARGELQSAHDQFTDFLNRFPNGPLAGLAKGQLIQVDNELATESAQKRQAAADAARAAAQARADLLARAARGEVTLSEMRDTLIGKTREQVSSLLGPPTETASDRWGFSRQMIVNPLTEAKSGLAVYFSEGIVQSVDYYYGTP